MSYLREVAEVLGQWLARLPRPLRWMAEVSMMPGTRAHAVITDLGRST